ncbi:MAG: SCO family protein [Rhodomicrobium sp.]
MQRINPVLFIVVLFVAGFAAAYSIRLTPQRAQTEGKALIGGPFSLFDTDGKRVTDLSFRGRLMLVMFGYTHCPDVCPTELQNIAEVMGKLGADASQVAALFITVDPQRDTQEALASYIQAFRPAITGLTGSPDDVASAAKAYRVYFRKAAGGADYTVDHSAYVYLMDREGNYVTHFTFNTPAETMVQAIKRQISGEKSS